MKQGIQQVINSNLLAVSWVEILNDLDVACFSKGPGKSPRFPLAALTVGWALQKGLSKHTRRIEHRRVPSPPPHQCQDLSPPTEVRRWCVASVHSTDRFSSGEVSWFWRHPYISHT